MSLPLNLAAAHEAHMEEAVMALLAPLAASKEPAWLAFWRQGQGGSHKKLLNLEAGALLVCRPDDDMVLRRYIGGRSRGELPVLLIAQATTRPIALRALADAALALANLAGGISARFADESPPAEQLDGIHSVAARLILTSTT